MGMSVVAIMGCVFVPIGRAIARRIGGGASEGATLREVQALREEVEQLRAELDGVHGRLGEVDDIQSRLDFAERVLAQVREKNALPGGR